MRKVFFLSLVFVFALGVMPVMAQNEAVPTLILVETDGSMDTNNVDLTLEGIELDEITEVPSAFGLWWRSVRENVSLGLTFDSVKKAEKSLQYAENRMKIADLMAAKTNDPAVQEKAQAMIERAQMFMEKVEAGKEKWANSSDEEKKARLMNNLAVHQEKREQAMNRIEEKLPAEKQEKFQELREKGLVASQRLMNALSNENIPEEVKIKLEAVKIRIEEHATMVREYNLERKQIQEKIKAGEEGALEEMIQLREQRKEEIKTNLEERKEIMQNRFQEINQNRQEIQERIQDRIEKVERPVINAPKTIPAIPAIPSIVASGTPPNRMPSSR